MTGNVRDNLINARALLERGWVQGDYAVDVLGDPTEYDSFWACSFCTLGAIFHTKKLKGDIQNRAFIQPEIQALGFDGFDEVIDWNDHPTTTKAEVLARFDKAIEGLSK